MIDFTLETHLDRSPTEVFDYITDPTRLPEWQTNTVSSVPEDDGPLGVGTRLREVHRAPGGKELPSVVEVSEYEPGSAFGQLTCATRFAQPLLARVLKRQFAGQLATLQTRLAYAPEGAAANGRA